MLASGGVSHVDTFDPKPALTAAAKDGKKAPERQAVAGAALGIQARIRMRHRGQRSVSVDPQIAWTTSA